MVKRSILFVLVLVPILALVSGCKAKSKEVDAKRNDPVATKSEQAQAESNSSSIHFEDVTVASGVDHLARSGYEANLYTMLEFVGTGVSIIDYDLDGLQDLVFAGGGNFPDEKSAVGLSCQIYRATAPFRFSKRSAEAKLDGSQFYNHGIFAEDIDADGFEDLLITGYGGLQVYFNQGDGTFERDKGSRTPTDSQWSTTAAFADVNKDGLLDLYVAHYGDWSLENNPPCYSEEQGNRIRKACSPEAFQGLDDSLFIQQADNHFLEQGKNWRLVSQGRGLGIVSADLDLDGDIDFYVTNDESENFLYLNNQNSSLIECGIQNGCAVDGNGIRQGSMGVAIGDYQGDLKPDLLVTNFVSELCALYLNRGRASFRFVSPQAGIKLLGPQQVSWGTVFQDFDNDGDEDLMIVSGHVDRNNKYHLQRPTMLENQNARLTDKSDSAGEYFQASWAARALAIVDHDDDGMMDCVISHLDQPSHVLRNTTENNGGFIHLKLIGTTSNRNAIGAVVRLKEQNSNEQIKHRYGGGSYLTTATKLLSFSSSAKTDSGDVQLEIRWPSGQTTQINSVQWNQRLAVVEPVVGEAKPISWTW